MNRRECLAAVASASAVGTAGCFWEDGDSSADPSLATVIVSNYADRRQRLLIHVEEDGRDALIDEIELGPGDNADPASATLDCNWTSESDELTIDVILLTGQSTSRTVSVPGDRYESYDVGGCVGLNFAIGAPGRSPISSSFHDCTEYVDDVDLCTDVDDSS